MVYRTNKEKGRNMRSHSFCFIFGQISQLLLPFRPKEYIVLILPLLVFAFGLLSSSEAM